MEFTLYYRGTLKANGGLKDKHKLRKCFHKQLSILWDQKPLKAFSKNLLNESYPGNLLRKVGNFRFAPLVTERIALIAEIDIFLLRPEPPGAIITQSGDIDNRLKTLLDALRMPKSPEEIPQDTAADTNEDPFFCLLEDDNLITRISVTTDRLLESNIDPSEVVLTIHVTTKHVEVYIDTVGLG